MQTLPPLQQIQFDLNLLKDAIASIPEWIAVTKDYARECGFSGPDGLRNWCSTNLPPSLFEKRGAGWFIHKSACYRVKNKIK